MNASAPIGRASFLWSGGTNCVAGGATFTHAGYNGIPRAVRARGHDCCYGAALMLSLGHFPGRRASNPKTRLSIALVGLAFLGCHDAKDSFIAAPECVRLVDAQRRYDARCVLAPFRQSAIEERAQAIERCTTNGNGAWSNALATSACLSALDNDVCIARGPAACFDDAAWNADASANRRMPVLGEYCGDDTNNCVAGLQCDTVHCVEPQGAGGECTGDQGCQSNLTCENRICTRRRGLGEPCHVRTWPRSDCELDALCDRATATCVLYREGDDRDD